MQMVGEKDIDILLDEDGQPVADSNGEAATVSDDMCWLQDLKNEVLTEEKELFYEDEAGNGSYGYGLLDFAQQEYDDFAELEIQQRIKTKMSKRQYIDAGSINTSLEFDGHTYKIHVSFKRNDSDSDYSIDIEGNEVEVVVE